MARATPPRTRTPPHHRAAPGPPGHPEEGCAGLRLSHRTLDAEAHRGGDSQGVRDRGTTLSGVWRVLRALGLSSQVPLRIALERNEPYIREWVRIKWPEIVERAKRTRATLVFLDESCAQTTPNVRRSWAEVGARPVLRHKGGREKVSAISGVTVDGELYLRPLRPGHVEHGGDLVPRASPRGNPRAECS